MSKNTFYFSHDYNARNDEKIKELIFNHGMSGYGIYWSIIEELYQNSNELLLNYERIAFELRTQCDLVKSVIHDFKLFTINDENFSSLSVEKRLSERNLKSEKARSSADKRWGNANAMQTHSEGNAIKERKGKNKDICVDESTLIDYQKFIDYFNSFANRNFRVSDKIKKTLKARLNIYTKLQLQNAIKNAHLDDYHIGTNFKYLTPEFILREDKLERFVNNPLTQNYHSALHTIPLN